MLPVPLVRGFVHQQLAAVVFGARAEHHIIPAVLRPHFRVAHMAGEVRRVVPVLQQQLVGRGRHPIAGDGERGVMAAPRRDIVVIARMLDVAGVIKVHRAVLDQRRARVHPVDIPRLVGVQHGRQLLPVQQVSAAVMSPVFDPARGVERAVLVKHMVPFPAAAQPVGVVEPADRRHQVEPLAIRVSRGARAVLPLDSADQPRKIALQCVAHTHLSPVSYRVRVISVSLHAVTAPVIRSTWA